MYKMSVFSLTFLCILFVHQGMGLSNHLFVCTSKKDLVDIELLCMGGAKINIVKVWEFESNHTYSCTNNNTATLPEEWRNDLRNPRLWRTILTNCADERHCNFVITHSSYAFATSVDLLKLRYAGIGIEYKCLPESKFIQFCNQYHTQMVYRNYFHLIFKNGSNSGINICRCTVQPRASRFRIIMNLFPSISGYLKEDANGREIRYKKGFTINHLRRLSTSSRKTLSVTYDFKKLNKVVPIFIVKFLAIGFLFVQCSPEKTIWTESPEKNPEQPVKETNPVVGYAVTTTVTAVTLLCMVACTAIVYYRNVNKKKAEQLTTTPNFLDPEQPTQETNPVVGYAVTATVTAITILGIVACTVIVYYRKVKKKKGTTPNKKGNVSASSKRLPGNSQASISFDVADSLSHSYAEVGSISDYRHYVMPDDTSMQSFRTKNFLEELEEKTSPYGSSANPNSKPPDDTATRRKEQALQDMDNADKTDTENSATGKEVACFSKSKMPENIERVHLQNEKAKNQLCLVLAETTDKAKPDENTDLPKKSGEEHKFDRENKTISREHYDTSGYLDLNITEKTSHQYLQKWIKEIHSVEENVRKESENEGIQQLGQRRVLIAENDLAAIQPDTFYSCADIHTIEFSEEETPFH